MMELEEARRFALSLPETTEEPHFDKVSFRVRGKIFATVPPDEEHLHVLVDEDEARAAVAEDSNAFEELWWGKRLTGVRCQPLRRSKQPGCRAPRRGVETPGAQAAGDRLRRRSPRLSDTSGDPDIGSGGETRGRRQPRSVGSTRRYLTPGSVTRWGWRGSSSSFLRNWLA